MGAGFAAVAAVLELRGLSKSWPGSSVPVFQDVGLFLPKGTHILIEGSNGAGKTTLLRVIAGLLSPDTGEVRVCDTTAEAGRVAFHREIGLASAGNSGLYARLSARHHLSFAARIGLVERRRRTPLIERAVERFALAEFATRRVDRLSMGQRQRLRLAMAFLHEPALVLLDEPLTSLDSAGREILAEAIGAHREAGRSVLWCGPSGEAPAVSPDLHMALADGTLRAA